MVAAFGVVLAAIYMLWAYQRVFTGPVEGAENRKLADLSPKETAVLAPLAALVLLLGLYPGILLERTAPSVGGDSRPHRAEHRLRGAIPGETGGCVLHRFGG